MFDHSRTRCCRCHRRTRGRFRRHSRSCHSSRCHSGYWHSTRPRHRGRTASASGRSSKSTSHRRKRVRCHTRHCTRRSCRGRRSGRRTTGRIEWCRRRNSSRNCRRNRRYRVRKRCRTFRNSLGPCRGRRTNRCRSSRRVCRPFGQWQHHIPETRRQAVKPARKQRWLHRRSTTTCESVSVSGAQSFLYSPLKGR